MTKKELIQRVIAQEKLGKIPFSFWTHFPEIDREPKKIAQATYEFYKRYDLDFVKTMNNGMYSTEDYGTVIDYSEVATGGVSKVVTTPIETYEDWHHLPELTLAEATALQRELAYLRETLALVRGEAPVVITVFSPLTTADKLSKGRAKEFLSQDDKGYFKEALAKIARLTGDFVEEALRLGADGIYFASQLGTYEILEAKDYLEYGKPYDLQVLERAQSGWFNSIHLHGEDTMFDVIKDYPVHVINWHIGESFPGPHEGQLYSQKAIMGGLNRWDVNLSNRNALHHQIYRVISDTKGKGIILSPACVIPQPFSEDIIDYIREIKIETELLILENSLESSLL